VPRDRPEATADAEGSTETVATCKNNKTTTKKKGTQISTDLRSSSVSSDAQLVSSFVGPSSSVVVDSPSSRVSSSFCGLSSLCGEQQGKSNPSPVGHDRQDKSSQKSENKNKITKKSITLTLPNNLPFSSIIFILSSINVLFQAPKRHTLILA